jgi:hypothetical protein
MYEGNYLAENVAVPCLCVARNDISNDFECKLNRLWRLDDIVLCAWFIYAPILYV